MDEQGLLVDINHASLLELLGLPGIKSTVADRIIAGRPYAQLEDLLQIRGIKANHFNKLRPLMTVTAVTEAIDAPAEPPEPVVQMPEDAVVFSSELPAPESDQAEPEQMIVMDQATKPSEQQEIPPLVVPHPLSSDQNTKRFSFNFEMPEKLRQLANEVPQKISAHMNESAPLSQAEAIVWGAGLALLVLILTAAITLGILGGINGSLSYIPSGKFAELSGQVSLMDTRLKQLQQDTTGLQNRMNTLEGLSGRVGVVEKDTQELKSQLLNQTAEIQKLSEQTQQIQTQIIQLHERDATFEQFFNGLKALLDNVFPVTTK